MKVSEDKVKYNKEFNEFTDKFGIKKESCGFNENLVEEQTYYKKIININLVLTKLKDNGLNIEHYGYGVCHNILCLLTAFRNTLDAYKVIPDIWKNDPEVIYAYWTAYIEKEKEAYDTSMAYYYPDALYAYLTIIKALEVAKDDNKTTTIIHDIIEKLAEDDYKALMEYCNYNLAREFINKDISPVIEASINNYMRSGRRPIVNPNGVVDE